MDRTNFKEVFTGAVMLLFVLTVAAQRGDMYTAALGKTSDSPEFGALKGSQHFDMVNDQHYLSSDGLELILKEGTLSTINFYHNGGKAYGDFHGTLPHGLKFGMSEAEVRNILGKPTVAYNSSGYLEFDMQGITYACSFSGGALSQLGISVNK